MLREAERHDALASERPGYHGREAGMRHFALATYSRVIEDGPDRDTRYRVLMHDLPRGFHQLEPADQLEGLAEPAPLTGTPWDALLAAVVEHLAWLHGHPVPAWVDD